MIEVLGIIASSWPIAIMVLGAMIASVVIYLIRWFKQADHEDKALRASQAVVVRERHPDHS